MRQKQEEAIRRFAGSFLGTANAVEKASSAGGDSWTSENLWGWLQENKRDAGVTLDKTRFDNNIAAMLGILSDAQTSNSKRKKGLKPLFTDIGLLMPGKLIDHLLKSKPVAAIDSRIAVQFSPHLFIISKELQITFDVINYIGSNRGSGRKIDDDFFMEAMKNCNPAFGLALLNDLDMLEGFYSGLLRVARLINSEHYRWIKDNESDILRQLRIVFSAGNLLINGEDCAEEEDDDILRFFLCHDSFHIKLFNYYKKQRGSARGEMRDAMKLILAKSSEFLEALVSVFPEYKLLLDEKVPLFYRFNEAMSQILFPSLGSNVLEEDRSLLTYYKLTVDGELAALKEGIEDPEKTAVVNKAGKDLLSALPFLRQLRKEALAEANQLITKIREMQNSAETAKESPKSSSSGNLKHRLLAAPKSYFGRDSNALDYTVRSIMEEIGDGEKVNILTAGSSTGHEGYDVIMSMVEYLQQSGKRVKARVVITDIKGDLVEIARNGVYTKREAEDPLREPDVNDYFDAERTRQRYRRFFEGVDEEYVRFMDRETLRTKYGIEVEFRMLDILDEPVVKALAQRSKFDLIIARNVDYAYVNDRKLHNTKTLDFIENIKCLLTE